MTVSDGWFKAEDLVSQIGKDQVTLTQIEKWRKMGLLPPYQRKFLGKPLGSESVIYPPVTVDQIRYILKLKKNEHIRPLIDIQSWLWIEGFQIETSLVIDNLRKLAEEALRFRVKKPEETLQRVEEISKVPDLLNKFGISTRKSLDEYKSVMILLIKLFSGLPINFDPETNNADYATVTRLEKMLGLEEARLAGFPAIKSEGLPPAKPWLEGIPGDYLPRLSEMKLLSISEINKSIKNATDQDVEQARKNLQSIIRLGPWLQILSQMYNRRFGLAAFNFISQWGKKHITLVLLILIHFEHKGLDLVDMLSAFRDRANEYQTLEATDKKILKRAILDLRRRVDRS